MRPLEELSRPVFSAPHAKIPSQSPRKCGIILDRVDTANLCSSKSPGYVTVPRDGDFAVVDPLVCTHANLYRFFTHTVDRGSGAPC